MGHAGLTHKMPYFFISNVRNVSLHRINLGGHAGRTSWGIQLPPRVLFVLCRNVPGRPVRPGRELFCFLSFQNWVNINRGWGAGIGGPEHEPRQCGTGRLPQGQVKRQSIVIGSLVNTITQLQTASKTGIEGASGWCFPIWWQSGVNKSTWELIRPIKDTVTGVTTQETQSL